MTQEKKQNRESLSADLTRSVSTTGKSVVTAILKIVPLHKRYQAVKRSQVFK